MHKLSRCSMSVCEYSGKRPDSCKLSKDLDTRLSQLLIIFNEKNLITFLFNVNAP